VYPETKEQRCWKHKLANALDKLPRRLQPQAEEMRREIMYAPDRDSALEEIAILSEEYGARYPKAVETLTKDQDQLLTFFDFPAEHWIHLRTTNPIESTFSTVKARTRKTKGAGSQKAGLAMAFKLLPAAEKRWRGVNAPHPVALVKAGVEFPDREAEMLQSGTAPADLFTHTPSAFAASEVSIHKIRRYLTPLPPSALRITADVPRKSSCRHLLLHPPSSVESAPACRTASSAAHTTNPRSLCRCATVSASTSNAARCCSWG
jgi:hypothetical protein